MQKVLWVGDSHSKNLDKDIFEQYTESKIEVVTAYTVDADSNAKYKEKNLLSIVPQELNKKKCDVLFMQAGCNEISNIDCQANPTDNYSYWEQTVFQSSEKMFDLAKHCASEVTNLKVVILTRLSRYDLKTVDPYGIKNKLSDIGNNVFTTLWVKNGCPSKIKMYDQNLGCHRELRKKRFDKWKPWL